MTDSIARLNAALEGRYRCLLPRVLVVIVSIGVGLPAGGQQVPDRDFRPEVPRPAFEEGQGPRLCLDEGHENFHTLEGRFLAFGELASRDGFRVSPLRGNLTAQALAACDLLVISNAQNGIAWEEMPIPTPSAFTPEETTAVRAWVERGGALLLIADHQPMAGAAAWLAGAFGARFMDGFAYAVEAVPRDPSNAPTLFTPGDGTLASHPIAEGRGPDERVTQVRSFTGQAFRWDEPGVRPLLVLPADYVLIEPRYAWQFTPETPQRPVGGWLQGATLELGEGRVALFGEAAMFSAQVTGPERQPMGMNAPLAEQNGRFVVNVLHWLARELPP